MGARRIVRCRICAVSADGLSDPKALVSALRRHTRVGGVAIIEDIDFRGHFAEPDCAALRRFVEWYTKSVQLRGADPNIGPRLPGLLRGAPQEAIQGGPLLLGPRDALVDEFDRLPLPGRDVRAQVLKLRRAGLVRRADARIEGHALWGQLHAMAKLCINAKQSIGGGVARRGRPIAPAKTRKGKRISFLLEDDVYRPLAHYCIDADVTIQRFVVEAICEKLRREHAATAKR